MTERRILLRSPTDPFEVLTPDATLARNAITANAGNMLFLHTAWRLLAATGVTVDVDRLRVRPDDADRINASYDAYVVPFANAFRPDSMPGLRRWTRLVNRLRIPVVVLGVGAQAPIDGDLSGMGSVDGPVRKFVAAVLERAPSIGVRGEFTASYLARLGFRGDLVDVIGCPSVFLRGPSLDVTKRVPTLTPDSPISVNAAPYQAEMGPVIRRHVERYRDAVYVAQDSAFLELLTYGKVVSEIPSPDGFPNAADDPMIAAGKARIFLSPFPWVEFMRTRDFVFGSRIHGNLAAVMAGTPTVVLAHDARTLELARYFEIPVRTLASITAATDAAELYADADVGRLVAGHPERWERFAGFMRRHGLRNAFDDGGAAEFDARIAATRWIDAGDPAGRGTSPPAPGGVRSRARRQRRLAAWNARAATPSGGVAGSVRASLRRLIGRGPRSPKR